MDRWLGMVIALAAVVAATTALGQPLVADLSSHRITIDSGFTGTEVLLYGATDGAGDLIVVVRGPEKHTVVRRKERVAGVWMHRAKMEFEGVPTYYAVAANRPLDEIARRNLLALHQIGLDALQFTPLGNHPTEAVERYRTAVIRNMVRRDLYSAEPGKVGLLGKRLFNTRLYFPANVPTGTYRAEVFLLRDGQVVSAETTPLFISKSGFQAEINYFARNQPALYGITAIVVALFAGWLAATAFRKT